MCSVELFGHLYISRRSIVRKIDSVYIILYRDSFLQVTLYAYICGDKHCFNNYRPISLLSSFSKLMEKIVASQMIKYMSKHNILYKHQYGFRKGHNTTLHILWYTFIIISMKISKKLTQNIIFHYL